MFLGSPSHIASQKQRDRRGILVLARATLSTVLPNAPQDEE
jgi:hypothetical protein